MPDANKSVHEGRKRITQKRALYVSKASAYRLDAKLLSVMSNSITSYEATTIQIDATSTH